MKPREDFYAGALPLGSDACLVIEVADASLPFDLRTKARLYAAHGVPAYWVVDLQADALHTPETPLSGSYTRVQRHAAPATMALPGLQITIDLAGLFGATPAST